MINANYDELTAPCRYYSDKSVKVSKLFRSTSIKSPSSFPPLALPCACWIFHIFTKKCGVLACSIPFSWRTLKNRGNRRLRPLLSETKPFAAIETGLSVILQHNVSKIRKSGEGPTQRHESPKPLVVWNKLPVSSLSKDLGWWRLSDW